VNCNVPNKEFDIITDSITTKIGKIKLSDSGFSHRYSEADATVILKGEGCALNDDLINISKETRPDKQSNCYRCHADFYKFKI